MKRILITILMFFSLSGCSVILKAFVKNETGNDIFITREYSENLAWYIRAYRKVEISWTESCINLVDTGRVFYFDGQNIPEGVVEPGIFGGTINVIYQNNKLYYISQSGKLIPLKQLASCPNA